MTMPAAERVPKTWFITGSSRGFGRQWAEDILERGDRVVAAARSTGPLDELAERYGDAVLALPLDITDREAAFEAIEVAHRHFGQLDVLVNNAGYGMFGMIEEATEAEVREQFETNFFGTLWLTQAVLPLMREQGAGHIIQISSVAGLSSFPGLGMYAASKWALEGMSQALAAEVGPFGIKVTLVEPTGYSTARGGAEPHLSTPLPVYEATRAALLEGQRSQPWGDPKATSAAMLALSDSPRPPLRLFLGDGPLTMISAEYEQRIATWREWEPISVAASGL
jgi:NAD(P)-dependent dehydrogenase (short-subunit alcohol dehydrogenase family)